MVGVGGGGVAGLWFRELWSDDGELANFVVWPVVVKVRWGSGSGGCFDSTEEV